MNQNAISWRKTLESLIPQFQPAAAEKGALAHLITEVADKERDKNEWSNMAALIWVEGEI